MTLRAVLIGSTALLLAAGTASAQMVQTGTLVVTVEDEAGGRVPGATVTAAAEDSVTRRQAVTDGEGVATLQRLDPSAAYVVTTEIPGFRTVQTQGIRISSGQTTAIVVGLHVASVEEQITVTAESPIVDTTNAITGQEITLDLTESLPTGRSYQSYLQLVPGVLPDDPQQPGNPASKSGLNYRDIGGDAGVSRDNAYYIDGINVTDPVTGTFGANLNTEIIQEQKVLTGGIPAEFVGTPGLVSSVITKSGSNQFHGSVNYFFQNDGLVADNKNFPDSTFSQFDSAATLGGPVIKDQLWFFGSYRRLELDTDVVEQDTGNLIRSPKRTENQWYGRATWSPTANDTLSFTFLNDPLERDGTTDRDITNARDRSRKQGGDRYNARYTRLLGTAVIELGFNKHNGEVSDFSVIREQQNNVAYRDDQDRTLSQEQLGGFGEDIIDQRDTQMASASLQWNMANHTVKAGLEYRKHDNFRDRNFVGGDAAYVSLNTGLAGLSELDRQNGSYSDQQFDASNASDYNGFIRTVDKLPNRASFYAAYDANGDGTIDPGELAAGLVYNSSAGNPNGQINYFRNFQSQDGEQATESQGLSFFAQDTWLLGSRLTINAGVRTERWEHFATTGENIYTFDWTFAPRVAVNYDIKGDGKQKLSFYYGKYYDPIRNNMTNFAGSISGRVREEQVYTNVEGGQWVTYRTRGGATTQDALFAPTTKTPFTDDLQLGYLIDLGRNMSFELIGTKRRSRDVLEDYDMSLYTFRDDGTTNYPGPVDHPDSLFLGLDYFGYSTFPESNFVIATLAGGARDYKGVEAIFRKRLSDNWQAIVSYTFSDATGNSNSDSNADFQGDVIWLDPRAPNQEGDQPGNIRHLFKVAASYEFDMGLQFGTTVNWNSGTLASRTFSASRRNLPVRVETSEEFEFAGINRRWLAPNAVGSLTNPSFLLVDLRVQYRRTVGPNARIELFADAFNVFDNQDAIREQDLLAGAGGIGFGEGLRFSEPRRLYLGARLSF